ncbi:hypothetical protein GRI89_04970 [Altererythrobacter salegens]|uniref:Uncharacterized protein n=1 Tax=Croceibacterium salegens TaxID=1737568 RepID=A0A6I4SSD8_9SPHN|nr:hypothetical protein [Croceibacterium salegens]MXO58891.1 hypothetical protein [Croceibacterium salegens]
MFRIKSMDLATRTAFEDAFDKLWTLLDHDPEMGLFQEEGAAGGPFRMLIPERHAERVESLSPGDWKNCRDATERSWISIRRARSMADYGLKGPPD